MDDQRNPAAAAHSGAEERAYLLRRAEAYAQLAEKADESGIRSVHLQLYEMYQTRAETIEMVLPD